MAEQGTTQSAIRFHQPGTLVKPGPLGRLLRLILGFACLSVVQELALGSSTADLQNPSWWFLVALGLLLVPYVVNIGLGLSTGSWPRYLSLLLIAIAAAASIVLDGDLAGEPLRMIVTFWMIYLYGHLGISFCLASLIGTPGCEMRAIPHLLGTTRGRPVQEHYCPAFIDTIDRWEQAKREASISSSTITANDPGVNDIMKSGGRLLLFYGGPFVLLLLTGNFGAGMLASHGPATAFLAASLACFVNIWRSKRVHCYFLGPWLLVAGMVIGLAGSGLIELGSGTLSLVINTALIGGVCLSMHVEMVWGRYFPGKPG